MKEGFESWLIKYGSDEREVMNLYKYLNQITRVLHDMKIGSAETRIDLIHDCWNLQKKIGKLCDEIDNQLQVAIDTHQKRELIKQSKSQKASVEHVVSECMESTRCTETYDIGGNRNE